VRTCLFFAVSALMVELGCGSSNGSSARSQAGDAGPDVLAPEDAESEASSDAGLVATCDNALLNAGCVAGACTVSATGTPLPASASLTVMQKAVPTNLNGDAVGTAMCSLTLSAGVQSAPNMQLSIALATAPDPTAALFEYVSPSLSLTVQTSQPAASSVEGLVTAPGNFGVTDRPAPWSLAADVAIDPLSSTSQTALLRNLSSQAMNGAFYDGTHLFVCNGPRLLIYSGIPANPGVQPSVILGQPDLNTITTDVSSSQFGNYSCGALWSDGTRLVAANTARLLVWNAIPSENLTPADVVLGQPSFTSNAPNNDGVLATTLAGVAGVDSDGTRLALADSANNRVLVWNTFPSGLDQAADVVVGQADFTASGSNAGATPLFAPYGVLFDGAGLFVADPFDYVGLLHVASVTVSNPTSDFTALAGGYQIAPNIVPSPGLIARTPAGGLAIRDGLPRIAMLNAIPTGPTTVDFVLGQPDTTHIVSNPVSASVVNSSAASENNALGAGSLVLVPDEARLLIFDTTPTYNFEPATRVLGQAGFTTNGPVDYRGISASTLAGPADVAAAGGIVAVADRGNNRVLLYMDNNLASSNASASVVLGQPDATSYVPNADQVTSSAALMSGPSGVALDGTHVIVADTENHRVLVWNTVPTATATPADLVLGQPDFTSIRPNRGRGDMNGDGFSDAEADGFFYPTGVTSDGTHLFVADRLNHRILVWNSFPTSNGQAADAVIGQPDFTSVQPNYNNGAFAVVGNGLNLPTGVALIGTTLWVADTENNRVVRWDNATTAPTAGAWIGQSSGTQVSNPNYQQSTDVQVGFPSPQQPTSASSVLRPRGIAVVGTVLYVTEHDSNRVHMFDSTSLMAEGELGQGSDTDGSANTNGLNAASLAAPLGVAGDGTRLWVADSGNHRVLGYSASPAPSTGATASIVLGQPGFVTDGFDQASTAANGASSQPHGLALNGGSLYVADTGNNRVLVMQTPVSPGQAPTAVYGQPDEHLALPNSGGAPSATTLDAPQGVFADANHVIVADTGNNRVLVYPQGATAMPAEVVLGQSSFTSVAANSGGVGASTMQAPAGVYSDGTSLWVADTGNHRVLVWNTFPTSNGQPADRVLGQQSFSGNLSNQGSASASASSLSSPSAVAVASGTLYVADTGNNRIVFFTQPPTTNGAGASGVLGQSDLTSRVGASTETDLAHLAGPVALSADAENFYVADRDLGRVLAYELGTIANGASASFAVGPTGGLSMSTTSGVATQTTALFTTRLYISDTGNNKVAVVQSVSRLH
jgi:sugar lactone lactonase YvrE